MVNEAGKEAWKNPDVRKWWETSGKYWYKYGHGPQEKKQNNGQSQLRHYEKNEPHLVP